MAQGGIQHLPVQIAYALLLLVIGNIAKALPLQVTAETNALFAGRESPYTVTVSANPYSSVTLFWELEAKGRLLGRGEKVLHFDDRDTITTQLPIQTPPVKRGLHIGATLTIAGVNDEMPQPHTLHHRDLFLYGPEPLSSQYEKYRAMEIKLFDPSGTTAAMLDAAGIPYQQVDGAALAHTASNALIVIGVGVGLEKHGDSGDWLHALASSGRRIVMLEPSAGTLIFSPAAADSLRQISGIRLGDAAHLPFADLLTGQMRAHTSSQLTLQEHRGLAMVAVGQGTDARWSWFALDYGHNGGLLALCMWPLAEDFIDHPEQHLALGHLLAFIHGTQATTEPSKGSEE